LEKATKKDDFERRKVKLQLSGQTSKTKAAKAVCASARRKISLSARHKTCNILFTFMKSAVAALPFCRWSTELYKIANGEAVCSHDSLPAWRFFA
jgi:hypothetical protein